MTREILNQIAKTKKINVDTFMKVHAYINPNYTKVIVTLYDEEGVGLARTRCNVTKVTLSVSAIQKRQYEGKSEYWPEDYETKWQGEWISDIA